MKDVDFVLAPFRVKLVSWSRSMKTLFLNLLLMVCTIPCTARAQVEYDFSGVDQLLADSVSTIRGLRGGSALLLIKDDEIIYDKSFGIFYNTSTIVPIASATKWLSAAVIMSLVDDGLIALDDFVKDYLPQFTQEKGNMTIRQMFSHTAGMPGKSSYNRDLSLTLAQAVDSIAQNVDLQISPGTAFIYGGVSMHVAGQIAEIVTGKNWETLFKERIAQPLGMDGTDYQGLGKTENYRIAGGAQSSAHEYANFLQMILNHGQFNGSQILSNQAVQEMQKDQTFGVPIVETPYEKYAYLGLKLPETRYGIGQWIERKDTLSGESIEVSSQGAFGFSPWIDRERNLVGVLSVKSLLIKVMPTYLELKNRIRVAIDGVGNPSSVKNEKHAPEEYFLHQNFPNPFNPTTTIEYTTPKSGYATIKIYNLYGQEIAILTSGFHDAGSHKTTWEAKELPVGIYFYRLQAGTFSVTKKLVLQK